ncbi:hypothetical protein [Aurantiacibacter aquimixticola]|uniref:hypothetical protein n=1 Tax=Aurantiacibacter aquimixticola TaxID=1958945 RepID=UPI000E75635D|nr:hypothetical protein [Aurantiacibacter aquimixticola]
MTRAYAEEVIAARAVVRVENAQYIRESSNDTHPYRVRTALVRGTHDNVPDSDTFEAGWGSAACDYGFAKPEPGDIYALYYWRRADGSLAVWMALPIDEARLSDPRGDTLLRSSR